MKSDPTALTQAFTTEILDRGELLPDSFSAEVLTIVAPSKIAPTTSPSKTPTKVPTKGPTAMNKQKGLLKEIPSDIANNRTWVLVVVYFFVVFFICCVCGCACGGKRLVQMNDDRKNRKAGKTLQKSLRASQRSKVAPASPAAHVNVAPQPPRSPPWGGSPPRVVNQQSAQTGTLIAPAPTIAPQVGTVPAQVGTLLQAPITGPPAQVDTLVQAPITGPSDTRPAVAVSSAPIPAAIIAANSPPLSIVDGSAHGIAA